MRVLRSIIVLAFLISTLASCATVNTLNTIVPNDPGAKLIGDNIAYGTAPRQEMDIYGPESGGTDLPVFVFVYGGSWKKGKKEEYSFVGHAFASRGYVTVLIDYRLVPEVAYPTFVEDTAKSLAYVSRNIAAYGGDPDKIFIGGHSAGAYNAVTAVMDSQFLDQAGVELSQIKGVIGLSGPYDFLPLDVEATKKAFGAADDLQKTQPVNLARAGLPPFFLSTGTEDETVFPKNSKRLAKALQDENIPVTLKLYEGLDHAETLMSLTTTFRGKSSEYQDILNFMSDILNAPVAQGEAPIVEKKVAQKEKIIIKLDEQSALYVDDQPVDMANLAAILEKEVNQNPDVDLVIRAADNIDNDRVLEMVRVVRAAKSASPKTH